MKQLLQINLKRPKVAPQKSEIFNDDEEEDNNDSEEEYMEHKNKTKRLCLEDTYLKVSRLSKEAIGLASDGRFSAALEYFNHAISLAMSSQCLKNKDLELCKLYEMKAQVLIEINLDFESILETEKALALIPNWAPAYQTLGRAQINYGEIQLAIRSISQAKHLNPHLDNIDGDLKWAKRLWTLEEQRLLELKGYMNDKSQSSTAFLPVRPRCVRDG